VSIVTPKKLSRNKEYGYILIHQQKTNLKLDRYYKYRITILRNESTDLSNPLVNHKVLKEKTTLDNSRVVIGINRKSLISLVPDVLLTPFLIEAAGYFNRPLLVRCRKKKKGCLYYGYCIDENVLKSIEESKNAFGYRVIKPGEIPGRYILT
jgi:hypothetical protein